MTKAIDPMGFTSQTRFDAAGQETSVIDALNRTTQQQYDLDGEVTKSTDPLGHTSQTLYDADGQATATIDALNRTTQQQYDLDGEVTKTIDANGNTSSQQYDNDGRVTASIDANNHTTRQAYDNDDRVTASIDGDGNTTQYRYDDEGNRTAVIDPNLNTTVMLFDADNQLTAQVDPLGHTTAMTYDDDGNQTAVIAPDHSSIVSLYDADNRLTMQVWYDPSGGTVDTLRKSFDNDGRLLTASNNTGTYGFLYDADGRVTSVTEPFGISLGMQYDASGQQTLVTDSFGGTQGSVYDLDGRLLQRNYSGQGQQLRIDYTYTLDGQVDTVSRYSNLAGTSLVASTTQDYDALGQVTNIQNYDASSATIDQFASQYDAAGNVTTEIDNGVTTGMTYDDANQLLSAGTQSYTFDPNGNSNNTGTSVGPGNQLLSDGTYDYGYDLKGNEISKTEIATGAGWTYGYNNANQLVYAKQWSAPHGLLGMQDLLLDAEYKYDFFGNRIEKDVTQSGTTTVTRFAVNGWDPSKPAGVGLENFDEWAVINAGGSLQTRNITGAGVDQPLVRIDQSGASDPSGTYWLLTDRLNSVRDVIDNSAAVKDSVKYDVYGNIDTTSETNASYRGLYDWTGRDRDAETGLQYNRARYYDPVTARWITQDPMGFDAGDSNLYRYVTNNPTTHTDPSGKLIFGQSWALKSVRDWLTRTHYENRPSFLSQMTGFGDPGLEASLPASLVRIVPSGNRSFLMAGVSSGAINNMARSAGKIGKRMLQSLDNGDDNIGVWWHQHSGPIDSYDGVSYAGTGWQFQWAKTDLELEDAARYNVAYGGNVFNLQQVYKASLRNKPLTAYDYQVAGGTDAYWAHQEAFANSTLGHVVQFGTKYLVNVGGDIVEASHQFIEDARNFPGSLQKLGEAFAKFGPVAPQLLRATMQDPGKIFHNLGSGVVNGVSDFVKHIGENFTKQLFAWLGKAPAEANLADYTDPGKVAKLLLDKFGLSWNNLTSQVIQTVGPERVELLSRVLSGAHTVLAAYQNEGTDGLFNLVRSYADKAQNLMNPEALKKAAIDAAEGAAVAGMAKLVTHYAVKALPVVGQVVAVVSGIYNGVQALFKNIPHFGGVVSTLVAGAQNLIDGTQPALQALSGNVVKAMGIGLRLGIGPLAGLAGAGNLPEVIEKAIFNVRDRVDNGIRQALARVLKIPTAVGTQVANRVGGPVEVRAHNHSYTMWVKRNTNTEIMLDGTPLILRANAKKMVGVTTAWDNVMGRVVAAQTAQEHIVTLQRELRTPNARTDMTRRQEVQTQLARDYNNSIQPFAQAVSALATQLEAHPECIEGNGACFAAGTKLMSPSGPKEIERFKIGEEIVSRNEFYPESALEVKIVEEVFRRTGAIWHLHANGELIRTTGEHPFFAYNKGWLKVNQLAIGDRLLDQVGQWVIVEDILNTGEWEVVYNLRIADYHTYFVTDWDWGFSIWSHNAYAELKNFLYRIGIVNNNGARPIDNDDLRRAVLIAQNPNSSSAAWAEFHEILRPANLQGYSENGNRNQWRWAKVAAKRVPNDSESAADFVTRILELMQGTPERHHIMTRENRVSTDFGGPYTQLFLDLARTRGGPFIDSNGEVTLDIEENIAHLPGHEGPHPRYNQMVYLRLTAAVRNAPSAHAWNARFDAALAAIKISTLEWGSPFNRAATGDWGNW